MGENIEWQRLFNVCADCPNRISTSLKPEELTVEMLSPQRTAVFVNEFSLDVMAIGTNGTSLTRSHETSSDLITKRPEVDSAFNSCSGPDRRSLRQKTRLARATCPALEKVFGGEILQENVIDDYITSANQSTAQNITRKGQ